MANTLISPRTARLCRMLISAMVTGAIAVGSNILTAVNAQGEVSPGAWRIALITGALLVLNDIKSYLSTPPQGPGL